MGRSSKEQSEVTARTLADLAAELFNREGYAEVRVEEVASGAGVTRGAVYHHFGSKLGLFRAVVSRVQEQVAARVLAAAEGADGTWAELVDGSHAFVDAATDGAVQRILLVEAPAVLGWQQWRELDDANSGRLLVDVLAELERSGELRAGPPEAAARLLSGAMNEAVLWIAGHPEPDTARADAHAALDRLLSGLRAGRDGAVGR